MNLFLGGFKSTAPGKSYPSKTGGTILNQNKTTPNMQLVNFSLSDSHRHMDIGSYCQTQVHERVQSIYISVSLFESKHRNGTHDCLHTVTSSQVYRF